jgi:RecA/RadA recombinase
LNEVDHYIKEELHIKYFGRYMDDLYLIYNDTKYLAECARKIQKKLKEIGLEMNEKKTTISLMNPLKEKEKVHGTPFKYLKWNFYITITGHIIMIPFTEKVTHQRRKLRKMQGLWLDGKITNEAITQSY